MPWIDVDERLPPLGKRAAVYNAYTPIDPETQSIVGGAPDSRPGHGAAEPHREAAGRQNPHGRGRRGRAGVRCVRRRDDAAARELGARAWPIQQAVIPSPRVEAWNLGAGETAVLSHALAHSPRRALVDDAAARRCAKTLDIPFLGTGGVLVLAKRCGLIASVTEGLEKLRDAGLWLSDDLFELLKVQAGE